MDNMFAKIAKNTTVKKTAKKDDKPVINIKGDEFDANLKAFADLSKKEKEIKTQLTMVKGFIKEVSLDQWFGLYKTKGSYPGSALVTSDSEASYLLAPSDRYLKLDEENADRLKNKYGDDIVTEDVEFAFDGTLLEKYAKVLTGLIQNSTNISDDDKINLIIAKKSLSVTKGSIEKALTVGGGNIQTFLDDIQPVYALKTPKLKG